ncbi:hypothetical protein WJX74_004933 [Apatococcus lobatus]|uniref:Uncharacterized protein n=1 Tax=Apatococcus lobatus TaxID=904363 RepID=A0AAW1RPM6_9CHLO
MAEAIKTSLPFVVDELFSVSTIDVVRSVSADKLKSALQWLVEGVQKLQGDQTVLRQDLAELFPQVAAFSKGPFVAHLDTQVPAEQKPPNSLLRAKSSLQKTAQDLGPLVGELADLQQRIQILEAASTAGPAEAATNGPQQDAQQQAQMVSERQDPSLQTDQQRDPQNADRIKALEEEVTRLSAALEGLTSRGSGAQSAIKVSDDFHADDASKPEALTETLQVSAQAFRPQAQAQPTSRSHASSYLPEDAAPERRPSAARSQPGDAGSGDKSQSDAWLEDQFGQLRAMLAGKADAQGLMALQAIVARKAESDDLHRLQASMPYPAGHAAAAELATVRLHQTHPSAPSAQQVKPVQPAADMIHEATVTAAALPQQSVPKSASPQQQHAGDVNAPIAISADSPAQEAQRLSASMPVQLASVSQQTVLPENLFDRLDGLASQDELQELRDQLNEVLEQLQQLSSQQQTSRSPDAIPSFPPGAGKMWIDVSTDNAMHSPRFASVESPIFASAPAEQSPRAQGPRKQQVREAIVQQQQEQEQGAQTAKSRETMPACTHAEMAGFSSASAEQDMAARAQLEMVDRASKAAPGWSMETDSLQDDSDRADDTQTVRLPAAGVDQSIDGISRQHQKQAKQSSKIHMQAPAGSRIRTAAFQKQIPQEQKLDEGEYSLRFEPVSPGPQTLLVSTPEKSVPAARHVPATVQMVLGSDAGAPRQVIAAIPVLAPESVTAKESIPATAADIILADSETKNSTSRVTDKLDAGQRLIVERALLPQQQAVWIQRPKTGASGGANSGDGQESVTVEQLAASLQTVAAVTHAMALGPPTQATSASSLAQRRQGSISKGLLEAPPALESLPLVDITAALGNALDAGCIQEKQDRPFGRRKANEAVTNRPAANANGAPSKETDKQIRALRTELALLKKRLEEMPMQLILPPADGDFAILASRPIMGYKCMACDRPLAHLEDKSGPAVSSNFLPARPGVDARRMGNAKVEEGRGRSGPTRADSPEREHAASVGGTPDDARSVHGLPMEKHAVAGKSVPGQELGPQLPKGGWRSKSPYEEHQHPHPRTSPASLGSTAT